MTPLDALRDAVLRAASATGADVGALKTPPVIERPKQADHGDYATNAAMLLTKIVGKPPRDVAAELAEALQADLGDQLIGAEVAGPGFLNLRLADAWFVDAVAGMGPGYGRNTVATPQKVNVEFVSANPTGPLHIGHSRNAAYGDAIARLLEFVGHDVHREYYVNDYGTQIQKFAATLQARARGEAIPEDGYPGEYTLYLSALIPDAATLDLDALGQAGVAAMLKVIEQTLTRFGVRIDTWFSERSLHEAGKVEDAMGKLNEQYLFRADGALWMRTTDFKDDKDRVLIRSTGEHTYFTSDIAYHQDKRERGFTQLIDVWGADHHGYIGRMKAAFVALGGEADNMELSIMQLVKLMEDGEEVKMSKRAGNVISVDWMLDEFGGDALRWFLLQTATNSELKIDVKQLTETDKDKNPVIYVQYMHARASKITRDSTVTPEASIPAGSALHPSERALVMKLADFPAEMLDAAETRAPHKLTTYAYQLAQTFSAFYRDCKIIGDPTEPFRVALTVATRDTLAQTLDLLGISAPAEM